MVSIAQRLYYGGLHRFLRTWFWGPVRRVTGPLPVLRRLPVSGPFRLEGHGIGFLYQGDRRDLIGRDLFWQGLSAQEPETFALLVPRLGPDVLFVDAGANTGLFSLVALAAGAGHVLTVEPVGAIADCLAANLALNGAGPRATQARVALGDADGEAVLTVPDGPVFPSSSSLLPGGWRGTGGAEVRVPLRRLDTLIAGLPEGARALPRLVVKIDVEGLELQVLRGMGDALARPGTEIVFEANGPEFLAPVQAHLEAAGFTVSQIGAAGLRPAARADFSGHDRNFHAIRRPAG